MVAVCLCPPTAVASYMLILDGILLYVTLTAVHYAAELYHTPTRHYMSATGCQLEQCQWVIASLQPVRCALRCELDAKMVDGWRPYLLLPAFRTYNYWLHSAPSVCNIWHMQTGTKHVGSSVLNLKFWLALPSCLLESVPPTRLNTKKMWLALLLFTSRYHK